MPDPLFDSRTARLELPLLFAGQSQKEGYVNEVSARVDALLHGSIDGILSAPPANPADGQCWLVDANPTGDWIGQAGKIAARQAGNWLFFMPVDGMRLLNRATGQDLRYKGAWIAPSRPADPIGGGTVDVQARAAIVDITACLAQAGIVPPA